MSENFLIVEFLVTFIEIWSTFEKSLLNWCEFLKNIKKILESSKITYSVDYIVISVDFNGKCHLILMGIEKCPQNRIFLN